jgi:hypothetical protein
MSVHCFIDVIQEWKYQIQPVVVTNGTRVNTDAVLLPSCSYGNCRLCANLLRHLRWWSVDLGRQNLLQPTFFALCKCSTPTGPWHAFTDCPHITLEVWLNTWQMGYGLVHGVIPTNICCALLFVCVDQSMNTNCRSATLLKPKDNETQN